MSQPPLKVLVVDDSIVFRKAVESALADEHEIDVIGSVRNGEKALEFMKSRLPDVITLDLEMPEMDGLATLKALQQINESRPDSEPIRAIMLSSHTKHGADVTMEALAAGAFDFVEKPEAGAAEESIALLRESLLTKFKSIPGRKSLNFKPIERKPVQSPAPVSASAPASASASASVSASPSVRKGRSGGAEVVAIGVSTGGPKALNEMMPELCKLVSLPILIVQHMPPGFTKSLAKQLDLKCQAKVVEAADGDVVKEGHVYIAPGGRHAVVHRVGTQIRIALTDDPPENGCRPSVDVLFRSVASTYGSSTVAAILTGMGSDGAKACKQLKVAGARILAQDEATSVVWGMPGSAVATGTVERVEALLDMPKAIQTMCGL